MHIRRVLTSLFSLALCGSVVFAVPALSQDAAAPAPERAAYVETFDGAVRSVMLNGVVEFGIDGDWHAGIDEGALLLTNDRTENAVRYYTLPRVPYPGRPGVTRTDGSVIEAVVESDGDARAGAGLLGGFDHRRKDYFLFAVSPKGQVFVLRRAEGKATVYFAEDSEAVDTDGPNRLRLEQDAGDTVFLVNGEEVLRVETKEFPGRGIGIGVFGRGSFRFDQVRIEPREDAAGVSGAPRPRPMPFSIPDREAAAPSSTACAMPEPSDDARIVIYGTHNGAALSTVSVDGQDTATTLTRFAVAPGEKPIYLVVSTDEPMISKIEGAAERIERLVLASGAQSASGAPAVGAAGLPGDRVSIVSSDCWPMRFLPDTVDAIVAKGRIGARLGRSPDVVAGAMRADTVSIPGGEAHTPAVRQDLAAPPGFDPDTWRNGAPHYPGGIADVEADQVVAAPDATQYSVLPGFFGLARLVADGSLERMRDGAMRIVRPLERLPVGFERTPGPIFVLAPGVRPPEVLPPGTCLLDEETGTYIQKSGRRCR